MLEDADAFRKITYLFDKFDNKIFNENNIEHSIFNRLDEFANLIRSIVKLISNKNYITFINSGRLQNCETS